MGTSRACLVDVHQRLLSEPLIAELALRQRPHRLVRRRGGWKFRMVGEADSVPSYEATDAGQRGAELRSDDIDRALLRFPLRLGIETLPAGGSVAKACERNCSPASRPGTSAV